MTEVARNSSTVKVGTERFTRERMSRVVQSPIRLRGDEDLENGAKFS